MNRTDRWIAAPVCAAWAALAMPGIAAAHEGHDHDQPAAASAAASTRAAVGEPVASERGAAPAGARFAATSDQFELVGVLDGQVLTLYLDRFADNAPVENARIEVEIGAEKLVAKPAGDVYVARLPAPPVAGTMPVTITIEAGPASDLLAADLATPAHRDDARPAPGKASRGGSPGAAIWAALAAAVAGTIGWAAGRRRNRT